jgi:phosphoribosylaminoimidazole-succinocarboxamide synthase
VSLTHSYPSDVELHSISEAIAPDIVGRSKRLWKLCGGLCHVELIPSLRSFTYEREEIVPETGSLRLDFYERAARRLHAAGVPCAFVRRTGPMSYLALYQIAPPFEVIVKNRAVGSTLRKYPGLFEERQRFARPVVKFDYRVEPEDQPIGEDYLRLLGLPVEAMMDVALRVNQILCDWLAPLDLWDFCLVLGLPPDADDAPIVISEISPDCMRLRHPDGSPLDKDLFRSGEANEFLLASWRRLLDVVG